jgi:hypothetical protein
VVTLVGHRRERLHHALAPVAIRWCVDSATAVEAARAPSVTTHGAPAAVEGCALITEILVEAISTGDKDAVQRPRTFTEPSIAEVAAGSWRGKRPKAIRSSGYVFILLRRRCGALTAPPISARSRVRSPGRCGGGAQYRRNGSIGSPGARRSRTGGSAVGASAHLRRGAVIRGGYADRPFAASDRRESTGGTGRQRDPPCHPAPVLGRGEDP